MSLIKYGLKFGGGALLFIAGYSFCRYVNGDERYSILRRDGQAYLRDMTALQELPIHDETFQIGTLSYRLEGVLHDKRLPQALEDIMAGER